MERQHKKLLYDIQQAIARIDEYLEGKKVFSVFQKNIMLRRAIEREFEIIGEAGRNLLELVPDIQITDGRKIVDLRNRISHGYDTIDDEAIWGIIINHLPLLKTEVEKLLNEN